MIATAPVLQYLIVFAVGGALCLVAQLLIDYTKLTPARILTLYVVAGVALTALGAYGPLVDIASCGATVPLTGFGYTMARGVEDAVRESGLIGVIAGPLSSASAGVTAAIVLGCLSALVFKAKSKK